MYFYFRLMPIFFAIRKFSLYLALINTNHHVTSTLINFIFIVITHAFESFRILIDEYISLAHWILNDWMVGLLMNSHWRLQFIGHWSLYHYCCHLLRHYFWSLPFHLVDYHADYCRLATCRHGAPSFITAMLRFITLSFFIITTP